MELHKRLWTTKELSAGRQFSSIKKRARNKAQKRAYVIRLNSSKSPKILYCQLKKGLENAPENEPEKGPEMAKMLLN